MSRPEFDKDIELLKITLLSEEIRASHLVTVGFWISFYITIVAGIFALLGVTDRLEIGAFVFAFSMGLLYVVWQIRGDRSEYDNRLAKLGSLIKNVEAGESIGDFNELLKNFRERDLSPPSL